ncbi:polysaccharide deacetylase family protein [Paracraurococcus ruber]|uniref:Chitooligosaccharide deacetylase n=1 Tax=Paracraurococcus ruber TaxID=77675 RepID=A0ABS1CU74_9PROT|nr:polysaccharide deacetylase family protein [Paracraurococcus ruber]MBK1658043.1 peptidase A8 [Paracraurococcus ruber]TDG31738.1 polysaccharide deacetylase family protein [Paracraurococcus ruber]
MRRRALPGLAAALALPALGRAQPACRGTVYLTIDTGWGREAEQIAGILRRRDVRATLFVADEPTHRGDRSLDESWAPFWRARAAEGHAFASHTWRHWYFAGDPAPGRVRYASRRGEGAEQLDAAGLCAELRRPVERLQALAPGARILPLWRAPGGITTPNALALAAACGLRHQGWTANGFWGDELDSAKHPNDVLARRAIERTRDGEVVVLHWGVRSRKDPFAEVLDPIIAGLQARGFCFATLPAEGKT